MDALGRMPRWATMSRLLASESVRTAAARRAVRLTRPGVGALERPAAIERQQQRDQVVDGDDDRAGPPPRRAPVGHERHIGAQPAAGLREGDLLEPELGQVGVEG